jgi:hypothetical protein
VTSDEFRYMAIVVTLLAGLLFPWAIYYRTRTPAALLVVLVLVINFVGASVAIADSLGEPLIWYRTPRIFVASVLALIYCAIAFSPRRPRTGRPVGGGAYTPPTRTKEARMSDQHALPPDMPSDEDDAAHLATEGVPDKIAAPDEAAFAEDVEVEDDGS